jgi:uncharacterized protein YjbI with pentapeptide repeats
VGDDDDSAMSPDKERKIRLEIEKLQMEVGPVSRLASILWPAIASFLTLLLSVATGYVACQNSRQEDLRKIEEQVAAAAKDTGDPERQRRVAAIWRLNQYWSNPDAEVQVSATLSSLLGGRAATDVECEAAAVIGNAITEKGFSNGHEAERSERIATMLYGNKDGRVGSVVSQNLLAKARNLEPQLSKEDFRDDTKRRCYLDPNANALDATKEAIRKNWEYLRDVNLNDTDLSGIYLYEADLVGATIVHAKLTSANFRCANVSGVDFTGSDLSGADFYLANVHDLKPIELQKYLLDSKLAFDWDNAKWERFRAKGFALYSSGQPIILGTPHSESISQPCLDLRKTKPTELLAPDQSATK